MPWSDWPNGPVSNQSTPSDYHDVQQWSWIIQAWQALRERATLLTVGATDLIIWPPPDFVYNSGTVGTTTDNGDGTLTFTMSGVGWDNPLNCTGQRWVGLICNSGTCPPTYYPANYDLIIGTDPTDPFTFVRATITAQTYNSSAQTGTLTVASKQIKNAVVAGYIPSITYLNAKPFYIIRQGATWASDRVPDKPDDQQLWTGQSATGGTEALTETVSGTTTTTTYTYLEDLSASWSNFATDEVLYFDTSGALVRLPIHSNTSSRLYVAHQTLNPGTGAYLIVPVGNKGYPGRHLKPLYTFYTGLGQDYYTHGPTDIIETHKVGAVTAGFETGDPCTDECGPQTFSALDVDLQVPFDSLCEPGIAGNHLAPDYWKSIRSLQNTVMGMCTNFVPITGYNGSNYTIASLFYTCGINAGESTLAYNGSNYTFTVESVYRNVFWEIKNADNSTRDSNNTASVAGLVNLGSGYNSTDVGKTVIYSGGYSRYRPRHFRYLYPKTEFIPTYVPGGALYDPPVTPTDDLGNILCATGQWLTRSYSSAYTLRGINGQMSEGDSFANNDLARYVGDNANDPSIIPLIIPNSSQTITAPYWDHFYRGNYTDAHQAERQKQLSGTASNGSSHSIVDVNQNWWQDWINGSFSQTATAIISAVVPYTVGPPEVDGNITFGSVSAPINPLNAAWSILNSDGSVELTGEYSFTGAAITTLTGKFTADMVLKTISFTFHGTMHTESGVATSGTSTTLTDSNLDTTVKPEACWWSPSRFTFNPYQYFILQIANGENSWRVPITNTSSGSSGVTFYFDALTSLNVSSGYTWSIVEPAYELNKWQGRTLTLTNTFGTKYTSIVRYNDDITLFFDTPVRGSIVQPADDGTDTVPKTGWLYGINEPTTGGVYKYSTNTFNTSAGADNLTTSIYYNSSSWTIATGEDSERIGVSDPVPFLSDATANLEKIILDYGTVIVDDLITLQLFQELYWTINALQNTYQPVTWTNRADPDVIERNYVSATTNPDAISSQYFWGPGAPPPDGHTGVDGDCISYKGPSSDLAAAVGDAQTDTSYVTNLAYLGRLGPGDDTGNVGPFALPCSGNPSGAGYSYATVGISENNTGGMPFKNSTVNVQEGNGINNDGTVNPTWIGALIDSTATAQSAYAVLTLPTNTFFNPQSVDFYNYATYDAFNQSSTFTSSNSSSGGYTFINEAGSGAIQFNSGGDQVAYNQWTKWGSGTPDSTGRTLSPILGAPIIIGFPNVSIPFSPVTGAVWGYSNFGKAGYRVTNGIAVLVWMFDFTGPYHG